jgi:hypothetical protein
MRIKGVSKCRSRRTEGRNKCDLLSTFRNGDKNGNGGARTKPLLEPNPYLNATTMEFAY